MLTCLSEKLVFRDLLSLYMTMAASQCSRRPKLIVFDLDYTLWPFWVDTHVTPPFREKNGEVLDATGKKVLCYREVPDVLKSLKEEGYQLAIASRTDCTKEARTLMKMLNIDKYFDYMEIYPGSKVSHFKVFHEKSGFSYQEMMFFDDEYRNIRDITKLGALCIFVKEGVNQALVKKSLEDYAKR